MPKRTLKRVKKKRRNPETGAVTPAHYWVAVETPKPAALKPALPFAATQPVTRSIPNAAASHPHWYTQWLSKTGNHPHPALRPRFFFSPSVSEVPYGKIVPVADVLHLSSVDSPDPNEPYHELFAYKMSRLTWKFVDSLQENGLRYPLCVEDHPAGPHLTNGNHRLAAIVLLGWDNVWITDQFEESCDLDDDDGCYHPDLSGEVHATLKSDL